MKGGARDRRCLCYRSDSLGRIVTNIQTAPSGYMTHPLVVLIILYSLSCHTVLLHGITKQTLAKVWSIYSYETEVIVVIITG